jgi:two-component system, sensor histidine kinase and response regulator
MRTTNSIERINVLLIEDNAGEARLVRERLLSVSGTGFNVEWRDRLSSGSERLSRPGIDVVLLDLTLPDSQGMETIALLHAAAPEIPIVALSGLDDESVIQDAVKQGAEDYLVKGSFSTEILVRTIRYAIDRRHLREDLAQARDLAIESARVRSEFLANMSHEIRTPLNGVVGMTRMLIDTLVSADQREMIEIASTSAESLLSILNDILDFSKISAGKVVLEETDFDLCAIVEGVVQIFSAPARIKGLVLDSFIDVNAPIRLRGDSGRLRQVLVNLVGNAVKFTTEGEATVRVERISGGADYIVLRFLVRDTGIGIPLDGQRNIFQAFTQADGSTTRRFGGTGLGLAISAQLVELMGGSIRVESEVGSGSTFQFTAKFAHQLVINTDAAVPESPRLEGVRALIVDSNATSARVIADHLRAWRMRSEIVSGASQALLALKRMCTAGDPFRIAIIDLQLPEQDGFDLARAIGDLPELQATRVLAIYALGCRPDPAVSEANGFHAVLGKPLKQSRLLETLIALIDGRAEALSEPLAPARSLRQIGSVIPAEIRQRIRILLVEDNPVNLHVEVRMIERIGYATETAANGRVALERLAHSEFDLILMDCQMPEMDGYTATREIRRREGSGRHTPIIGVTARALTGDREECLDAGMDDYIAKPVMIEDLAALIDRIVQAASIPPPSEQALPLIQSQAPNNSPQPSGEAVLDETVLADLRQYQNPGEPDFITELIGVFNDDLANRLAQMHAGVEADDANIVRQAAHALKGASGELGAQRMRAISLRLEQCAAEGSLAATRPLVQELEDEAVCVRAALAPHCIAMPVRDHASGR